MDWSSLQSSEGTQLRRGLNDQQDPSGTPSPSPEPPRVDNFALREFELSLTMSEINGVNSNQLADLTQAWLTVVIPEEVKVLFSGCYSEFTTVVVQNQDEPIISRPENEDPKLVATFSGQTLWERKDGCRVIQKEEFELVQQTALIQVDPLLTRLQEAIAPEFSGLGTAVLGVRAMILPDEPPPTPPSDDDDGINVFIIIAVVVGAIALSVLLVAIAYAYREYQRKKQVFMVSTVGKHTERDSSDGDPALEEEDEVAAAAAAIKKGKSRAEEEFDSSMPSEIEHHKHASGPYSESGLSSLSPYYRSDKHASNASVGTGTLAFTVSGGHDATKGALAQPMHDAYSMDSMDSYGYSLDGYAPSTHAAMSINSPAAAAAVVAAAEMSSERSAALAGESTADGYNSTLAGDSTIRGEGSVLTDDLTAYSLGDLRNGP